MVTYWQISFGDAQYRHCLAGDSVDSTLDSGRIKLDINAPAPRRSTSTTPANTTDTGQGADPVLAVNSGNNVLERVGRAHGAGDERAGEVSTIGTLNCSGLNAVCNMGPGVTLDDGQRRGGQRRSRPTACGTTITIEQR